MHSFLYFEEKSILFKRIFIWHKDISFELIKCYLIQINLLFESKKAFQTNYFLSFNRIFFLSVTHKLHLSVLMSYTVINFCIKFPLHVTEVFFSNVY